MKYSWKIEPKGSARTHLMLGFLDLRYLPVPLREGFKKIIIKFSKGGGGRGGFKKKKNVNGIFH